MRALQILVGSAVLAVAAMTGGRPTKVIEARMIAAMADLDGDREPDEINVIMIADEWGSRMRCVLEVNRRAHAVVTGDAFEDTVAVVDIDNADAFKELIVMDAGPSDDYLASVFRYSGGSLRQLGTIPAYAGIPVCDGDGLLHTEARGRILHTWYFPVAYRMDTDGVLVEVPAALKPMNTKVTLKMSLDLQSLDSGKPCGRIRRGERAIILETDDVKWCHIRSERGRDGWFDLNRVLAGGRVPSEIFDGLCFAD